MVTLTPTAQAVLRALLARRIGWTAWALAKHTMLPERAVKSALDALTNAVPSLYEYSFPGSLVTRYAIDPDEWHRSGVRCCTPRRPWWVDVDERYGDGVPCVSLPREWRRWAA